MEHPVDAILGLLGLCYLLDFDYPHQYEVDLTVLHYFTCCDRSVLWDILESFNATLQDYNIFKNG